MNATKTREISNSDDVIDSRDIIARIEELESIEGIEESIANLIESDEATELVALRDLASQGESYSDWEHGAALIRDSHFKTYAMDLADDIGAVPNDATWPCTCIDWDKATRELQMDYTSIEFDDVTYWIR